MPWPKSHIIKAKLKIEPWFFSFPDQVASVNIPTPLVIYVIKKHNLRLYMKFENYVTLEFLENAYIVNMYPIVSYSKNNKVLLTIFQFFI